jgi:hypothetical protein
MTRLQLLQLLVGQARSNGFEFRRWYTVHLGLPWHGAPEAVTTLSQGHRYYALLFSHEFAANFWKAGVRITFQVPTQTFTRKMADGNIGTVQRKGYMRRSARENAWLYHLREMAAAEDPLRYMRRYLRVMDELDAEEEAVARLIATSDALPESHESASDDAPRATAENGTTGPRSKVREHRG